MARILFRVYMGEYAFFCGQQCIENYLKGYLKFKRQTFPDSHDLIFLLDKCRALKNADVFINSEEIKTIARRFNPFNELARYPIQKSSRPKNGTYALIYPDIDIEPLDYFILKMREIIDYPTNMSDILKEESHNMDLCKENCPALYNLFKIDNVNFS